MGNSIRWLWIVAILALASAVLGLVEVVRLDRRVHGTLVSDMVVVPRHMDESHSTVGMGASEGGGVALFLRRFDTNAGTRMSMGNDGAQTLDFYDQRGKLRLSLGIDSAGSAHIRFIDAEGIVREVAPTAQAQAPPKSANLIQSNVKVPQ